jgi:hypothetical protein
MSSGLTVIRQTAQPVTPAASPLPAALSRYYSQQLPPITPGDFQFFLTLLRGGRPPLDISAMVPNLEWQDEGTVLGGNLELKHPDGSYVWVARGHQVRCDTEWQGKRYNLWTMRCEPPQDTVEAFSTSITMVDELDALRRDKLVWHFNRTSKRRRGWTADEIALAVCQRLGCKVGKLLKGKLYQHFSLTGSGIEAITKAYQAENQANGVRYVMRMVNGHFEVVEYQRNPLLYVLKDQITHALTSDSGQTYPVTLVRGYGYIGDGHARKQLAYTAFDTATVRQLGYVPAQKHFGRVNSQADLEGRTKRALASDLLAYKTATITHPGIPFIRRGEGVQLDLPNQGFAGKNAFVYCASVNNSSVGDEYTTELTVSTLDPFSSVKAQDELYEETAILSDIAQPVVVTSE